MVSNSFVFFQVFLGNYDSGSVHVNYFEKPIHARYVRLYPNTWHVAAAMRVEVLGCYVPYRKLIHGSDQVVEIIFSYTEKLSKLRTQYSNKLLTINDYYRKLLKQIITSLLFAILISEPFILYIKI